MYANHKVGLGFLYNLLAGLHFELFLRNGFDERQVMVFRVRRPYAVIFRSFSTFFTIIRLISASSTPLSDAFLPPSFSLVACVQYDVLRERRENAVAAAETPERRNHDSKGCRHNYQHTLFYHYKHNPSQSVNFIMFG